MLRDDVADETNKSTVNHSSYSLFGGQFSSLKMKINRKEKNAQLNIVSSWRMGEGREF
jgi:hypothetical protein